MRRNTMPLFVFAVAAVLLLGAVLIALLNR